MSAIIGDVVAVLPQFVLACVALAVLPGPATALALHRAVRDGRGAGLAAVIGNDIGLFCWAVAAGAGLTALRRANEALFEALHIVGAAVLVHLGISAWRKAARLADLDTVEDDVSDRRTTSGRTPVAAFRASLVTVAANPKTAVFAFSFFPQFLPKHGPVLGTSAALAIIQVVVDGAHGAGLVLLAVRVRHWLSRAAVRRRIERTLGAVLVALGIGLAVDTR